MLSDVLPSKDSKIALVLMICEDCLLDVFFYGGDACRLFHGNEQLLYLGDALVEAFAIVEADENSAVEVDTREINGGVCLLESTNNSMSAALEAKFLS